MRLHSLGTFSRLLALVTALGPLAPNATAQFVTGPRSYFFVTPPRYPVTTPSGGPCHLQGTTSIAGTCSGAGVTLSGSASATSTGVLRSSASISVVNQPLAWSPVQYGGVGLDAFSQGTLLDVFTFVPQNGATGPLSVTYRLAADGSSSADAGFDAFGQYGIAYGPNGVRGGRTQLEAYLRGPNAASVTDFTATILPNVAYDFSFYLLTVAGAGDSTPPNVPFTGQASADFLHTMYVQGYTVRDAAGHDVTASVTVNSAAGIRFSALPEPRSWALLGTGLLVLGGVGRRRARGRRLA